MPPTQVAAQRLLEYNPGIDRSRLMVQCGEHLEILGALERNEVIEASYLTRRDMGEALHPEAGVSG